MTDARTEHTPDQAELRAAIQRALRAALSDTYDCGRVWSAWSYGTMDEDDFTPVLDRMEEIIDEIVAQLPATPPAVSQGEPSSDLECAAQLERSGLISREKYNHICENIRARDRMREAMA